MLANIKSENVKTTLILVLGLFYSLNVFPQDWAPIGAVWHYDEQFAFAGDIDYIKFESVKDTTVLGKLCKKITKRHRLYCYNRAEYEIMYSSNDTVYFYDLDFNGFQILYDFSAGVGDSWGILLKDVNDTSDIDSLQISVDSTDTTTINGNQLKRLFVTYSFVGEMFQNSYQGIIIQSVGDIAYMFNFPFNDGMVCDINYSDGIRCYDDSVLGLYLFMPPTPCDAVAVGITEFPVSETITISPNPTNGVFNIHLVSSYKLEYVLVRDLLGRLVLVERLRSDGTVDMSHVSNGTYLVELFGSDSESLGRTKIVKI